MTKQQLQTILNKAMKMEFLDLIEYLTEEEKNYAKSEFYKKTRIPLLQLFKEYTAHSKINENSFSKLLQNFSEYEDYAYIAEKVADIFDYLNKNEEVVYQFERFFNKFLNSENLEGFSETLESQIKKLRN